MAVVLDVRILGFDALAQKMERMSLLPWQEFEKENELEQHVRFCVTECIYMYVLYHCMSLLISLLFTSNFEYRIFPFLIYAL